MRDASRPTTTLREDKRRFGRDKPGWQKFVNHEGTNFCHPPHLSTDPAVSILRGVSVDDRLAVIERQLVALGIEGFSAPTDSSVLDRIDKAVAPLRLPAGVRRFWELVDPNTLRVLPYPRWSSPDVALKYWRNEVADGEYVPRLLFPFAYESHVWLDVELHGPDEDDGGALFIHWAGGEKFHLTLPSIESLLDHTIAELEQGHFRRAGGVVALIPPDQEHATTDDLQSSEPHTHLGHFAAAFGDRETWPPAWQERSPEPWYQADDVGNFAELPDRFYHLLPTTCMWAHPDPEQR